jgi:DNA-binding response OmpR family regulator
MSEILTFANGGFKPPAPLLYNGFELEFGIIAAKFEGKRIPLTFKESLLFGLLLSNPSTYFSVAHIRRAIWPSYKADIHTIEIHVYRLRQKLEASAPHVTIRTVPDRGYALVLKKRETAPL